MIFRKRGGISNHIYSIYENVSIEIVLNTFLYLGIVFTSGRACFEAQKRLAGQSRKGSFTLNKYLFNFTSLTPSHALELFDKLFSLILNFGSEVWGISKASSVEKSIFEV